MDGPSEEFRNHVARRAEEVQSEEDLERLLGEIEEAVPAYRGEPFPSEEDPLDVLAAVDAWAALASYAVARFYAPSSPWPGRLAGWERSAARRLRSIAAKLEPRLRAAAQFAQARSWSIGVSFPWGVQISLTWP